MPAISSSTNTIPCRTIYRGWLVRVKRHFQHNVGQVGQVMTPMAPGRYHNEMSHLVHGGHCVNTTYPSNHFHLSTLKCQLILFFISQVSSPCSIQLCTQLLYNFPLIRREMSLLLSIGSSSVPFEINR